MKKRVSFLLALALLLTSCGGGPGAAAATMHLRKIEGTVGVSDNEGKDVTPKDNLGLYSGYGVGTQAESYAWIDLDKVKLAKLDQDSEIAITKDGRKLEIEVKSGSMFFNVTQPLAEDETMDIRTSTMMVGIRGTCGWVTDNTAALLEGTVTVTAGEQEVTVSAGEMAVLTEDGTLEVKPLTAAQVPAFVKAELEEDSALAETVKSDSGLDVLNAPAIDFSDPIHLRDRYTYSRMLNYNTPVVSPTGGYLIAEFRYAPDAQGRIGTMTTYEPDGTERSSAEYVYNDMGTLSEIVSDGVVIAVVTEDTADHRTIENSYDLTQICSYDEQGHLIERQNYMNGEPTTVFRTTYDAEGKLIREDCYNLDGQIMSYCLYEYD